MFPHYVSHKALAAAAVAAAVALLVNGVSLRAKDADAVLVLEEIRATLKEPGDMQLRSLHVLLEKRPSDSLVLYAIAHTALQSADRTAAIAAMLRFPDDSVHVRDALWFVVTAAIESQDLDLLEKALRKLVPIQKTRSSYPLAYGAYELQLLHAALSWRDSPIHPEAARRAVDLLAECKGSSNGNLSSSMIQSMNEVWPDEMPLTQTGWSDALARHSQKAADENERNPTVEAEEARIRAIRSEREFQVEIDRFERRKRRAVNGRLTGGPENDKLAVLTQAKADIERIMTNNAPAAWKVGLALWWNFTLRQGTLRVFESPRLRGGLDTFKLSGWPQELARRRHPDAVARHLPAIGISTGLTAQQVKIAQEKASNNLKETLAEFRGRKALSPALQSCLALHALQLNELDLARSVLEPRTPDADADPFVVRARLLVDLRTKDYTSIGPAVRRYIDTLATDRPVNDAPLYDEIFLLMFVKEEVGEIAPRTADIQECLDQLAAAVTARQPRHSQPIARYGVAYANQTRDQKWNSRLFSVIGNIQRQLVDQLYVWQ